MSKPKQKQKKQQFNERIYFTRNNKIKIQHEIKGKRLFEYNAGKKQSKKTRLQLKKLQGMNHTKIVRDKQSQSKSNSKGSQKQKYIKSTKKQKKLSNSQSQKSLLLTQRQDQLSSKAKLLQAKQKKNRQSYLKLLKIKVCVICNDIKQNQELKRIFCTKCDDAYHRDCLQNPLSLTQVRQLQQWYCEQCQKPQQQLSQSDKNRNEELCRQNKELRLRQNSQIINYCKQMNNLIFKELGNYRLFDLNKDNQTIRQSQCFYLKPFTPYKQKQKYWMPLINALSSTNYLYCSQQVYNSKQTLQLNKSKLHEPQMCQMFHKQDEHAYQQFRQLIQDGQAPPLTVQKCERKGYLIKALADIEHKTIICEYAGQVMTFRQTLIHHNNDSIYRLLETGDSRTTLDIIPTKYGNISKYFLGINNSQAAHYNKINVQSQLFSYKGRNRIIFYTTRRIKQGQNLYIDYNAGTICDYPTQHFD